MQAKKSSTHRHPQKPKLTPNGDQEGEEGGKETTEDTEEQAKQEEDDEEEEEEQTEEEEGTKGSTANGSTGRKPVQCLPCLHTCINSATGCVKALTVKWTLVWQHHVQNWAIHRNCTPACVGYKYISTHLEEEEQC
jgi:hypothetical protein